MATTQRKRAAGAPARTFEEIEARAAEVRDAERQALKALIACIREIAVRLPADSRLPLDLAGMARVIGLWVSAPDGIGLRCATNTLTRAIEVYMPMVDDEGEEA